MRSVTTAARRISIPGFESSQAEAEWFDSHQATLPSDMQRRFQAGEGRRLAEALAQSAAKEKARRKAG